MSLRNSWFSLLVVTLAGCTTSEGPSIPPTGTAASLPEQSDQAKANEVTAKSKLI